MSEVFDPALENKFEVAKVQFGINMLQDELISGIVASGHRRDPSIRTDFPDLSIEPTLRTNEDGTVTAGISIVHGSTFRNHQSFAALRIADRIPLITMSALDNETMTLSSRFAHETRGLGVDPEGPEPYATVHRWQENWGRLMRAMQGEVEIDPSTHGLVRAGLNAELPPYFDTHDKKMVAPAPYDFEALAEQYSWLTNVRVPTDYEEYEAFRRQYKIMQIAHGPDNVRYGLGALDEGSGAITRVPGFMGLYSPKERVSTVPYMYSIVLEPITLAGEPIKGA